MSVRFHARRSSFSHEPTTSDTHERDDNVILAQFVDLGNASVCHRERNAISVGLSKKTSKKMLSCRLFVSDNDKSPRVDQESIWFS